MKRHPGTPRALALLLALAGALALAAGCTEKPTETPFDNPFDPDGESGGDPFQLVALYVNDAVFLSWQDVGGGVEQYQILHSLDGTAYADIDTVDAPTTNYAHQDFAANRVNWYKVRGLDAYGRGTDLSATTAAAFQTPPRLAIGEADRAASRYTTLTFTTDVGDSVVVDSLPDFSTAVAVPFDEEGLAGIDWDLGPAVTPTDWKHVYFRAYTVGIASAVWHDSIKVRFDPSFTIYGSPATVARRTPTLSIGGEGVTQMRFAPALADLDAAEWIAGAATWEGYELTALADTQHVFAEFASDFGFTAYDSLIAVPDSLQGLELVLNGGSGATGDDALSVYLDARATEYRAAATPAELALTPWAEFSPGFDFVHDGCASDLLKTVHVQVRNDWFTADALSASIQWLPPEALGATIDDPGAVESGAAVTLTGTAAPGTCSGPLDLVEVDTGTGWTAATGLETWTFAWTAPDVAEETVVTIGVRVGAGAETYEGSLDVTVSPAAD